jgi:ureidoacrylate peracid hydrolase
MSLRTSVKPGLSRRSDFPLRRHATALLIIDVQRYLSYPDQEYYSQDSFPRAVKNIDRLTKRFRSVRDASERGCEIIFTHIQSATKDRRDISIDYKLSGETLANIPRAGDDDASIFWEDCCPETGTGKGDIIVPKTSCSVFQSTNLHYLLSNLGIEQLVITGQLTDQCVQSAVRDAADLGYFVTLVEDACAAYTLQNHDEGLRGMEGFCRILTTDGVIREIDGDGMTSSDHKDVSLAAVSQFLKENGFIDAAIAVVGRFSGGRTIGGPPIAMDGCERLNEQCNATQAVRGAASSSLQNEEDIVTVADSVELEAAYRSNNNIQLGTVQALASTLHKLKTGRDPSALPATTPVTVTNADSLQKTDIHVKQNSTSKFRTSEDASTINVAHPPHREMKAHGDEKSTASVAKTDSTSDASPRPPLPAPKPLVGSAVGLSLVEEGTAALPSNDGQQASHPRDLMPAPPTFPHGSDPSTEDLKPESRRDNIISSRLPSIKQSKDPVASSPKDDSEHAAKHGAAPILPRYKKGRDPSILKLADDAMDSRASLPELASHYHRHDPGMASQGEVGVTALLRHRTSEVDSGTASKMMESNVGGPMRAGRAGMNGGGDSKQMLGSTSDHGPSATGKDANLALPRYKSSRDPSVWGEEKGVETFKMDGRSPGDSKEVAASTSLSKAQYKHLNLGHSEREGVSSYPESVLKAVATVMVGTEDKTKLDSPQTTTGTLSPTKSRTGDGSQHLPLKKANDPPASKAISHSFLEL